MWTVRKGRRSAVCELWTDPCGWELRLTIGGALLEPQVCPVQDDMLAIHEAWKAAMIDKDWRWAQTRGTSEHKALAPATQGRWSAACNSPASHGGACYASSTSMP